MTMPSRTVPSICIGVSLALSWMLLEAPNPPELLAHPTGQAPQAGRGGGPQKPSLPPDPKQLHEGTPEDDVTRAGSGDDWLFGQAGNDFLMGGGGSDKIDGGEGDDTIDGGPDADILDGGPGFDTIRGGDGDDTMDGGDDDDLLDGGAGADDMDGGDGNDVLRGGAGNDVIAGGDNDDTLSGQAGNDRLIGGDENDTVAGGAGNDVVLGGEGDDNLSGDAGDDHLDGDVGNDLLRGGPGNDILLGSGGSDTLQGAEGHDTLAGGDGPDMLSGAAGHDWMNGGAGADVLNGGDGDDIILLRAGDVPRDATEIVNGEGGTDVLILNGFMDRPGPDVPRDLVDPVTGGTYRLSGIERVEFAQLIADAGASANRPVSLLLVNPSTSPAAGRVIFFGPTGAIVPASAAPGGAAADDLTFTVPPLGSLRLEATVGGPAVAQVSSTVKLATLALGGLSVPGGAASTEARFVDSAIVPIVENRTAGIASGLLLAGSVTRSSVTLTLNRPDGQEVDSDTLVGPRDVAVPAYGHQLFFVRDVFPQIADFQGTLVIDGGYDRTPEGAFVAVAAVEQNAKGAITMSPAYAIGDVGLPGPSHIAGVATGGAEAASVMLVNASPTIRAVGALRFYNENGQPWPVAVNGQPPAATLPYDLAPRGSVTWSLPTGGQIQRGSLRADTKQGVVGVFVRSLSTDGAAVRVPSSEVLPRFIAAARRSRADGTTTRLSVSSTGQPVSIQLQLRDAAGRGVTGGTATLELPANGQSSRSLEELFPSAATDAFDGTIAGVASAGQVAVTVVQTAGAAPRMALPVVPLQ
jgi:hypothetical protein